MSAQDLIVTQSLDKCLDMLPACSRTLFAAARAGYDQHGCGSLVTAFANFDALEDEKWVGWHYLPRDMLSKMDYSEVLRLFVKTHKAVTKKDCIAFFETEVHEHCQELLHDP